jgi:hypothetical protein
MREMPNSPDELRALWKLHDAQKEMAKAALKSGYQIGIIHFHQLARAAASESLEGQDGLEDMLQIIDLWAERAERDRDEVIDAVFKRALDE